MFLVIRSLLPLRPPQPQGLIAYLNKISGAETYKAWVIVEIKSAETREIATVQDTAD